MKTASYASNRKTILVVLGTVIGSVILIQWLQILIRMDPFAAYRNPLDGPFGGSIALRMENVAIKYYKGNILKGACNVGRLDVHKDRRVADFYLVKSGFYNGPNGRFDFQSDRAQWDGNNERLYVLSGAKIRNEDMNVIADAFEFNQKTNLLYVNGEVKGKLFDGQVKAKRLTYSLDNGFYRLGPTEWAGLASLTAEDTGDKPTPKKDWKFKSDGMSRRKENVDFFEDVQATDGDIIVKSEKMEHDRKTDIVTATGKVFYFSEKTNMSCDKAVIYRKEKRAVLSGNVQMILKPKEQQKVEVVEIAPFRPVVPEEVTKDRPPAPKGRSDSEKKLDDELRDAKNIRKYPITLLSKNIEYWYAKGSRHAVITGSPQAQQALPGGRWRYVWTVKAYYDGELETLKMEGTPNKKDVKIMTSKGDDLIAYWFTVSTKEETNEYEAKGLEGTFVNDDEEDTSGLTGDKKTGDKKTDDKKADDKKSGDTNPPLKGKIGG